MKSATRLPVRTRIGIVFNLLAGIALVMVLTSFVFSLDGWHRATRIAERNAMAAHSLAAVKHFAFERGRTNVILRGKTVITEKNRQFIDERRRHADIAMTSILTAADSAMFRQTQVIEQAWATVKQLRVEVERDFARALDERDGALPGRWMPAANALVAALEALLVEASHIPKADFHFARLAALRIHALQFRNAVGSESTRLSAEVSAGRVPQAQTLRETALLRGAAQQLWRHIEGDVEQLDNAALQKARDKVGQTLLADFHPLMDAIVEAAQQNRLPAFTIEHYTQRAVPALDAIIEMVDGIDHAIAAYAAQQLQQAQRLLAGALLGLTITFLLVYLGRRVLAQDLIQPLQLILDRIYRLRGSTGRMPTLDPGNLDNIAHALDLLEDALNELRVAREAAEASRRELDEHRRHLEGMVETRTAALSIAKESAEAANRAKSTFLTNMSHELRTPMSAVMGMIDMALRRATDPKQIDQLAKAKTASQHLLRVINDILDISKIEAERLKLECVDFRLGEILENIVSLIGHKANEKGIKLLITPEAGLPEQCFNGDPMRLAQVLLNLAGNALKFTDQGSVTLRIQQIEDSATEVWLRWEVADTGIGISAEDRKRLFTAFEQADNSTTRKYGGTGLGLAISKRLVNMMGGEIGVDSVVGQGSTFWFTVRLGKAKRECGAVPPAPTFPGDACESRLQAEFAGVHVLLAEDEPVNQEVSRGLLEDVGLVVDLAEDGQQALALARQNRYALILMDMQMPVMNGVAATQAIRADSRNSKTPVLAMTANAFDEDRQVCLDAGMNDHIAKPVDPAVLYEVMLKWLEQTP